MQLDPDGARVTDGLLVAPAMVYRAGRASRHGVIDASTGALAGYCAIARKP